MATLELTVAYPGREGAHSAAACDRLFPAARLVPLSTFPDVAEAVATGRVPYGVLPIESSLVGPVAETHDLLYESPLSIVAEAILPVNHCLVGPAPIALAEIREIHSHPVALDQCRKGSS
jgi:prephenate dehydratase